MFPSPSHPKPAPTLTSRSSYFAALPWRANSAPQSPTSRFPVDSQLSSDACSCGWLLRAFGVRPPKSAVGSKMNLGAHLGGRRHARLGFAACSMRPLGKGESYGALDSVHAERKRRSRNGSQYEPPAFNGRCRLRRDPNKQIRIIPRRLGKGSTGITATLMVSPAHPSPSSKYPHSRARKFSSLHYRTA